MRIAFVTEMGFVGRIPKEHSNMRVEFAWMNAFNADHYPIYSADQLVDYDHVFVIFPKGRLNLNAVGDKISNEPNPFSQLLSSDWLQRVKFRNKQVHFVQEGPHWLWNDYELADQINFFNMMQSCDSIFAHNEVDVLYYKGLFPSKKVNKIPTIMIEHLIKDIEPNPEDKAIIGGNFARWYGGFESYIVAQNLNVPLWGQTSHAMRQGEDQLLNHLPRVDWINWMKNLSTFKYAVHLMPTVAAGTFSLNCAYFGIPCIGNSNVDTQRLCHPMLSVDVGNVKRATELAIRLKEDREFYDSCSKVARVMAKEQCDVDYWKQYMIERLNQNETK